MANLHKYSVAGYKFCNLENNRLVSNYQMRKLKNEELNRPSVEEYRTLPKIPVILLLDDVRSMHNVGSAFRTADSFGLEKIILCGITGKPPHREINKTALGATESVAWEYYENVLEPAESLQRDGYKLLAIEQADESIPLNEFTPVTGEKYLLVFGNEVNGVNDRIVRIADHVIEIPQSGTKHSLNISVSIGIVVWDFISRLKK
jgi:23S rRNA (guanosine2251-2'-O)-methyltransferase